MNYKNKQYLTEQYVNQKKSMKTIAKENNIGETCIHKWLHRFEIPIRSRSEAMSGIPKTEEHKRKVSETRIRLGIGRGVNHPNYKGGKKIKPCIICGTTNKGPKSDRCARCRFKQDIGEYAPNWKNGISKRMWILRSRGSKPRRNYILERDNYECVECGADRELEIHHIKPVKEFPELVNDYDNCITLCVKCHDAVHYSKENSANSVKPDVYFDMQGNAELNSNRLWSEVNAQPTRWSDKCVETIHGTVEHN